MPSVLIVDDEPNIRRMVGALLGAEGYEVRDAQDGSSGLQRALESEPDVLLLDLMMPGDMDGMATLAQMREKLPDVPVVMMSGRAGLSDAVRATKLGAFNFLEKPLSPEGVLLALSSALELRQVRREAKSLRREYGLSGDMVGDSPAMGRVRELIARVGGGKPIRIDVRILSATNKDLARCVHEGTFREDLFFRLNVIPIPLPPLRERPSDIPGLVRHFSALHRSRTGQRQPSWSDDAMALLARHRWPGNVRELANIVERLAILHAGLPVEAEDVSAVLSIDGDGRRGAPAAAPLPDPSALD